MMQMSTAREAMTVQEAVEATQYLPDEALDARLSLIEEVQG